MGVVDNIRIGDCEVYIDYADGNGEQSLGETLGGIEVTFERELVEMKTDKYGTAPIDIALSGNNLMIKTPLVEITTENISRALSEGVFAENASDSKMDFGRQTGYLLSSDAGLLRLHPRRNAPSERDEDVYIWKAVSVENVELSYKSDEQRILEVTWKALVDTTKPDGQHLGRIGDVDIS